MKPDQYDSLGRHNIATSRHRSPAGGAGAGLSIVVPVYNEAAGLAQLHARITAVAAALRDRRGLACEIVYVDDGSRDTSLDVALGLPATAADVQVVSLSRNFGKEAALLAGLDHASRGAVLFMDADGQHPPAMIEKLVGHWLDGGYDVVYTAKAHRENEPTLLRLSVRGFYALINWGARQKIPEDAGDFRLLSPRAAAALRQLPERNRFFKGLASWIGFRQVRVDYEPAARAHGITTFSPGRLVGLSIEGLTSFSVAPLRFASLLGVLLATGAFLFGLSILWETLVDGKSVPGYPSIVVGLMTIGGVQLIMIGIVGEYIGKILSELKARPIYFVAEHSEKHTETGMLDSANEGPRPNEAPHLAVRRRLRNKPRRQPRHSRFGRTWPSQCDVGHGRRGGDQPVGSRCAPGVDRRQSALRNRSSRHPHGAVSAFDNALQAARGRDVPHLCQALPPGGCGKARRRDHLHRSQRAACNVCRPVRPRPGLCRRPPACAVVPRHTKGLPERGEGRGAQRLGSPMRTQPTFAESAGFDEGAGPRCPERAVSPAGFANGAYFQFGLCRGL